MTSAAAILDEGNEILRTIELDCIKIAHDETSEETSNALMFFVAEGKEYLFRWDQTHMENYPNEPSDILPPHNFDLVDFFSSDFATDACDQGTKIRYAMEVKVNDR